jgi:hypothetical protein
MHQAVHVYQLHRYGGAANQIPSGLGQPAVPPGRLGAKPYQRRAQPFSAGNAITHTRRQRPRRAGRREPTSQIRLRLYGIAGQKRFQSCDGFFYSHDFWSI